PPRPSTRRGRGRNPSTVLAESAWPWRPLSERYLCQAEVLEPNSPSAGFPPRRDVLSWHGAPALGLIHPSLLGGLSAAPRPVGRHPAAPLGPLAAHEEGAE